MVVVGAQVRLHLSRGLVLLLTCLRNTRSQVFQSTKYPANRIALMKYLLKVA